MPLKLDLFTVLRRQNGCPFGRARQLVQPAQSAQASTMTQRKKRQDPYYQAQARAKRAANISRQQVLQTQRSKALGDPVRGIPTPFLESFDTIVPPPQEEPAEAAAQDTDASPPATEGARLEAIRDHDFLNHFVTSKELDAALRNSRALSAPWRNPNRGAVDPDAEDRAMIRHQQEDANAREAVSRIASLANSNGKDRLHVNIQRCIEAFGRHKTDAVLRPKPAASLLPQHEATLVKPEKTPRAGPDTGSSEVQIAILTAKIRALANFLDTRGKRDFHNKRNLRLLVHKRQKLLKYLRRKERGGERWQHLIKTLGLTEGTWQGEISL